MIKNFTDAFMYVNQSHAFNWDNYPVMSKLRDMEQQIFTLKHGLLHMQKHVNKIGMDIPAEKKDIRKLQWVAQPDNKLGDRALKSKKALLEMVVSILSITKSAGFDVDTVAKWKKPTDKEMLRIIPMENLGTPIQATFKDVILWYMESMAGQLEEADHENKISLASIEMITKKLYCTMIYWFDDFWVPDFLAQIQKVTKRK
jgi:hypothetical protein